MEDHLGPEDEQEGEIWCGVRYEHGHLVSQPVLQYLQYRLKARSAGVTSILKMFALMAIDRPGVGKSRSLP